MQYTKFPDASDFIQYLVEHKTALFAEYLRPANARLAAQAEQTGAGDTLLPSASRVVDHPDPDSTGLFCTVKAVVVARSPSLMDLSTGYIHLQNLVKRGAALQRFVSTDKSAGISVDLTGVTHIIVFGQTDAWTVETVARALGRSEREMLLTPIKVVSSDWISHSIREGSLVGPLQSSMSFCLEREG